MSHVADYLIVQHVKDLFRRETKNVGVVVRLDGKTDGCFFGETKSGTVNRKQTERHFPDPGIYAQWVKYWRRTLTTKNGSAWDEIIDCTKGNYQVLAGGSVDRIGEDSIRDVTRFLFAALVSEGGMARALGAGEEEEAIVRLDASITLEFRNKGLLIEGDRRLTTPRYPIVRNRPIKWKDTAHIISYVQAGPSNIVAMEPIDIASSKKKVMKYHAGWAAKVFEDIREENPATRTIAIISATSHEQKTVAAKNALALLSGAEIVNWLSDSERKTFLVERAELAHAA